MLVKAEEFANGSVNGGTELVKIFYSIAMSRGGIRLPLRYKFETSNALHNPKRVTQTQDESAFVR